MKILAQQVLRGPNYWSNTHTKLIQTRLLLDSDTFSQQSLVQTAKLALDLQNAAGCALSYWCSSDTRFPSTYILMVSYQFEEVGKLAVKRAVAIFNAMQAKEEVDFEKEVEALKALIEKEASNQELAAQSKNSNFSNIPILAVTGSNGKTTTTRLLAYILKISGKSVGYTTSDGIYINDEMIDEGDTTGPISAQVVLQDERIEIAVLESARGGILRAGLGFTNCDLAVVTNVQDDHLGISDIETMEDLAKVKSVLVKAVKPNGFAVLNADNVYTTTMGNEAACKVAWFSTKDNNPTILKALAEGNAHAFIEEDAIVIKSNATKIIIATLAEVPITFNGSLKFMVENVLAASLAAYSFGVEPKIISQAIKSFYPSADQTPGRMNIFELNDMKLLVDFAHNPDGFAGIRDFLATVIAPMKIGIIVGTGDRKESDTRELGRISAQMFDLVLIHQVKFLRGKTDQELVDLLVEGIHQHNPDAKWLRIPDSDEPLSFALGFAVQGSFIVALSDVLSNVQDLVVKHRLKV